ncbi:MAG: class I SAM-dependent methyltransferase [Yoonia sp.]|uniref:class I SAM-dependent methyltransferase n=1 Tax=Yoonia sp. TaxID=2212373 RepID=UPI00273EF581|nr:class I SAM-dependent methyltransferase [Yoonia sp.]MDP5084989.1 class I SAM-dependent methyltransferase [Yoonia sp.]
MRYDINLFLELNEEYKTKPLVAEPPKYDKATLIERANKRAINIDRRMSVSKKRVLEIGCGRGEVCRALNSHFGCEVVGVDVSKYPNWDEHQDGVSLIQTDLTDDNPLDLGSFDIIYSNSVWEHVRHPYRMLERAFEVLKPGGHLLLSANLYRGPKASHRYREIFFPWPHLLFSDEVIDEFYRKHLKKSPVGDTWMQDNSAEPSYRQVTLYGSSWVNQLSIADYFNYFNLVGFEPLHTKYSTTPLDEDFLQRFADKLDRYPRYDLERDFIHVTLLKPLRVEQETKNQIATTLKANKSSGWMNKLFGKSG